MELRSNTRYRLEAPVVFTWNRRDGKRLQGEGVTRDISATGAFILTPSCPPTDIAVTLDIMLPRLQSAGRSVTMVTQARVIRVEHQVEREMREGFAVVSEGFAIPVLAVQ